MMDVIDQSESTLQINETLALQQRKDAGPPPCGECHYCGEPLNDGRRFCDADCRDDWQKRQAAQKRNGSTGE